MSEPLFWVMVGGVGMSFALLFRTRWRRRNRFRKGEVLSAEDLNASFEATQQKIRRP